MKRLLLAMSVASLVVVPLMPQVAHAAELGYRDFSYRDASAVQTPTADKSQSKLWFQDGSWWGLLYSTADHGTSIHRLDLASQTWVDTGTIVDTRPTARGDALWDGASKKLYVVSGTTVVSEFSSPPNPDDVSSGSAELSRFSYNAASKTYALDAGFPVTAHRGSTEDVTIAKDSTGALWITYTMVAPDNSSQVYVVHSVGGDLTWGTPFALPTTAAAAHYDDISAIASFQGDKVGIMWSNQLTKKFYFAVHHDGASDTSWQTEVAYGGGVGGCSTGCANDHVNLKQLSTDGSGRVFAAIKTANRNSGQTFVVLLVRDQQGSWRSYEFGQVQDLHTRPMVMIDEEHREVFMFAVAPEVGGTIYYKKSSLDNISFPPGQGTPFMQSDTDPDVSDPTSTKQSVNSASGIVLLASANQHARYWHNYMNLSGEPPPAPPAPTNLTVSSPPTAPDSTLSLRWSDNGTNESGFKIERKIGSGSFNQIATVGADTPSYTDTGLTAGATYTYRVRAWNASGDSAYSDTASGTTTQTSPVRTFTPVADTYVDSSVPNANYGTKTNLLIDSSPVQEGYLKFNVSGVAGSTVTSAKLRLYVSDNGSVKGGSVAKMSSTSWTEAGVAYNTRPAIDGTVLSTLGAVNIGSWYEFNVTPAVTADGTVSLGLKTSSSDGVHYAAREDAAHAPQLVVTVSPGDTTPPDTTISSGPSGLVASDSATLGFSSSEPGSSFECSLDGSAFAACTSPKQYAGLAQGSHTFRARAIDAAGNIDATPASRTWNVDTIPPATVIDSQPAKVSTVASASFAFSSDETGVTYACTLDGSQYSSCTSPANSAGLGEGSHTFGVRATDAAGNTDPVPPTVSWTVDTIAPETTIDTGPQGGSTTSSATFTFSSNDATATFACSLDGATFSACTSPAGYSDLADGSHTFAVAATDAAGNVDPSPATRSWTVDTVAVDATPPTVTLTQPADASLEGGRVTLSAVADDDVAIDHVDFLVDGSVVGTDATAPYAVTWDSTTVPDGRVTVTARAVDTSANATTSGAAHVTVDNTAPQTSIDSHPNATTSAGSATFTFSSDDTSARFACSLDAAPFSACVSPLTYSGLADGSHSFAVRASDEAGNVDGTPATHSWTIDTTPPETTITSGPSGAINARTASFPLSSDEVDVTFECRLDGADFVACSSPASYSGLADGVHTFAVRATDAAGNVDPTPATRAWTVEPVSFSDGFETGDFSRWTSVHTAIDGVASVQSRTARSGLYSAYLTAPSSTSYAYARQTLAASQTNMSVSGDFNVATEGASGQEVPYFKLYDSTSTRLVYLYRRNISGRIYVVINGTAYPTTATIGLGVWAHLSIRTVVDGSASTIEASMDGASIYTTTTASLGTSGVRTIQIGNDKQLAFALYADNIDARIPGGAGQATPPETTIDSGPSGTVSSASASFSFSADQAGATFECSLDGASFSSCSSPRSYSGLADGAHTFEVRATDAAGNADLSPATRSWTVDTTAPQTTIDSGPSGTLSSASASFSFSADEPGSTFECSLDGASFASCTSPRSYGGLADGSHTFQVRATDGAGNTDPTPAARSWTVDTSTASPGIVRQSSSTTANTTAATTLSISRPTGTSTGDVLVACLALNGSKPTATGVPAGWTQLAAMTSVANPRVFGYYHVAGASEPGSYQWALASSVAGGGGIARYTGVNTATPLDGAVATASGPASTTATIPGITTSAGAMLVGCMGANSTATSLTIKGPTGMNEVWDIEGKRHEYDDELRPTAGATGSKTWTLSASREWAGWLVALKPA